MGEFEQPGDDDLANPGPRKLEDLLPPDSLADTQQNQPIKNFDPKDIRHPEYNDQFTLPLSEEVAKVKLMQAAEEPGSESAFLRLTHRVAKWINKSGNRNK